MKFFWFKTWLTALFLTTSRLNAQEPVVVTIPSSPLPWVIITALLLLILALVGIIFALTSRSIGNKAALTDATAKKIENSYARKIRNEYNAKQELLDKRIDQVRQRFSMVMYKVKSLLDTLDPEQLFKVIVDLIENDIGAQRYILFLFDPTKNELYPFRWSGYDDRVKDVLFVSCDQPLLITYALKRRQTIYRSEATSDIEIRKLADLKPVSNTLVAVPLFSGHRYFGLIHIESFKDGHTEIDESEKRFLSSLPTFVGGALANADIFVQTRSELTSSQKVTEQEIQEKKRLREIFSRYTSAELVDHLIENSSTVDLGGTNKEASILFTDIAGFTAFSAKLAPQVIVSLMNEYLSRMTEVILNHNGEIDKFIGDAIMARFGVLSDLENTAQNAVDAACAMLEDIKSLQEEWAARGIDTFDMRVGIATGTVLAGNIGSTRRQEFTVMGNTVNLASRLESLNKELKTRLLIDEATFKALPKGVKFVKHEGVRIRGLKTPVDVYEILQSQGGPKIISLSSRLEKSPDTPDKSDDKPLPGLPGLPDINNPLSSDK